MTFFWMIAGVCAGLALATSARGEDIDGGANVTLGNPNQPYVLDGKIDGHSTAAITGQTIWIKGKIDGKSTVTLNAVGGGITIGDKIDGGSQVTMRATGQIIVAGKIDGHDPLTKVDWCSPGGLDVKGGINGGVPVKKIADCK
jgi:hypothetical protein